MDDGVVDVLSHGVAGAEFGSVLDNQLASRCILILEVSWVSLIETARFKMRVRCFEGGYVLLWQAASDTAKTRVLLARYVI